MGVGGERERERRRRGPGMGQEGRISKDDHNFNILKGLR